MIWFLYFLIAREAAGTALFVSVREAAGSALFVAAIAEANRTVPVRFYASARNSPRTESSASLLSLTKLATALDCADEIRTLLVTVSYGSM